MRNATFLFPSKCGKRHFYIHHSKKKKMRLASWFFCQSKAQNDKNFRLRRAVTASGGPAGQTGQTAALRGGYGASSGPAGLDFGI
jgi:hypothetical protein